MKYIILFYIILILWIYLILNLIIDRILTILYIAFGIIWSINYKKQYLENTGWNEYLYIGLGQSADSLQEYFMVPTQKLIAMLCNTPAKALTPPSKTKIAISDMGKDWQGHELNEITLAREVIVLFEGNLYTCGNRRNFEVELFEGKQFYKTVSTEKIQLIKSIG